MAGEKYLLLAALLGYATTILLVCRSVYAGRAPGRHEALAAAASLVLHTAALAARWTDAGHGPFITMHEILSSNIWSLTLIYLIACWNFPVLRPAAVAVLPLLLIMTIWMMVSDAAPGHLPPTYQTPLLYLHVGLGKIFLGLVLTAVGIAGTILLRPAYFSRGQFSQLPEDRRLEELAFRFMLSGFVFESAMLVVGAVWAQDAWGRYWAWDPLETWAFLTWLAIAGYLHLRMTLKLLPAQLAWVILGVFAIAFLTFFGVPFVSTAPHKGAV